MLFRISKIHNFAPLKHLESIIFERFGAAGVPIFHSIEKSEKIH